MAWHDEIVCNVEKEVIMMEEEGREMEKARRALLALIYKFIHQLLPLETNIHSCVLNTDDLSQNHSNLF